MRRKYKVFDIDCEERYKVTRLKHGQFFKGNRRGDAPYIAVLMACSDAGCKRRSECNGLYLKSLTPCSRSGLCGWVLNALDERWNRITKEKAELELILSKL